jgi:cytochrome P450
MLWMILLMANNIEMQKKMRDEIASVIGDRMATHEDKDKCKYVQAFILESLRYRPSAPLGIFNRAMHDRYIGNSYYFNKDKI